MSMNITIRDRIYEKLSDLKNENSADSKKKTSFSDAIQTLFDQIDKLTIVISEEQKDYQETTVTQEGRISKTLAGKTILYKVKSNDGQGLPARVF